MLSKKYSYDSVVYRFGGNKITFEKREHGFDGVSFESDLLSFDKMVNAFQFCV